MSPRFDNDSPAEREPTAVEQAALGWVVRSDRGLTAEQERELAEWLAARPEHRALFAEFGGTWALLGRAPDAACAPPAAAPGARRPAYSEYGYEAPRRRGSRAWTLWAPLAAAAALAFAWVGPRQPETGPATAAFTTEVGAMRELTLADGSVAKLNTDTVLQPVFTPGERRVRLARGEAFFQVARDPSRPFVVEAAGVGVRALGTAFNVRLRDEAIEVIVTEGRVRVGPEAGATNAKSATPAGASPALAGASAEVGAGERVSVPVTARRTAQPAASLAVGRVAADEARRALAWQERRLEFSDTPLTEMVAELNRYHPRKLVVADASLEGLRFGGLFSLDDRAGFVRILRENFGITAEDVGDQTLLRAAQ